MSLESSFEKGERLSEKKVENSKTSYENKTAVKRKYQASYLNYMFITVGGSHSPRLLCIIMCLISYPVKPCFT